MLVVYYTINKSKACADVAKSSLPGRDVRMPEAGVLPQGLS